LENIDKWARIKGLDIVSAPDFTHPVWLKEMKKKLVKQTNGFYILKDQKVEKPVYFIPVTEVSCIYTQGGKVRKVHLLIFLPDFEDVEKFNSILEKKGANLRSDGRPILGMSAKELLKIMMSISPDSIMVPAHIWTPWFAVFGSKSGFDSLEECFEELTPEIRAVETGLSSDPEMNGRLSQLDNITLLSNSDAHSPKNIGREANVFEIDSKDLSYNEIIRIIKEKDLKKFKFTIEFFPEEGMYYFDGHRECNICYPPSESKKNKDLCPVCKKKLTIGVMHRVDDLADKKNNFKNKFKNLIPLREIISEVVGKGRETKTVEKIYFDLIAKGKNELNILLNLSDSELENITDLPKLITGIRRVRAGKLIIQPGYDGVYGRVKIFD
jgi:uncharacterized protein (TIGR00375 family)